MLGACPLPLAAAGLFLPAKAINSLSCSDVACFAPEELGINPDIPKDPNFHRRIGSKNMEGVTNPYGVEDEK